jgi:xanthine/uracil permease
LTAQVTYIQKVFFVTAASLLVQLFWGHRLPLIIGPATVLLVGIVASQGSSINAIYTAIMVGGGILALLSVTGLFAYLKNLFTSRVIATILILIAFTITPTILNLILTVPVPGMELLNFCFALLFVPAMFWANRLLSGIWKSTLIIWALIAGSLLYLVLVPQYQWLGYHNFELVSNFLGDLNFQFALDAGVLISFLVCFLALSINDLGSIQSVGQLIKAPDMTGRVTSGITFTGLSNVVAGFLGVIGPVNFSLSTGIIASNGNASRFTLIPTGIGLLIISFLPGVVAFIGNIPSVIVGIVLMYIMCSQIAAGLTVAFGSRNFNFEDGLVMSLPLMLGIIVSFLPGEAVATFPPLLVPIIGNGFVVGVLAVLIMEHVVFRR